MQYPAPTSGDSAKHVLVRLPLAELPVCGRKGERGGEGVGNKTSMTARWLPWRHAAKTDLLYLVHRGTAQPRGHEQCSPGGEGPPRHKQVRRVRAVAVSKQGTEDNASMHDMHALLL